MTLWRIVLLCFTVFDKLVANKRQLPDPLSDPEKLLNMDDIINFDYLKDIEDIIKSKISLQPMLPKFEKKKEKETDTKELSFADLLKAPADVGFQIPPEFFTVTEKIKPKMKSSSKSKKKRLRKQKKQLINFKQLMELDRFLHSKTNLFLEDENEQPDERLDFKDILGMGYRKSNRKQAKRKKQKKGNILNVFDYQKESAPELASELKLSLKSLINQLEHRNQEMTIKDLVKILKSKKFASDTEGESESDKETVNPGPLMKLKPLKHKSQQNKTMPTKMKKKKKNTRIKLTENEMKNMAKIISLERMIRPRKPKKQRKPLEKIKKQQRNLNKLVNTPLISLAGRKPGLEALIYAEKNNGNNDVQNLEEGESTEETTTEEYEDEETETTWMTDTTDTTESDTTDTTDSDTTETDEDETTETDVTEETTTDVEDVENATLAEVEAI